MRNTQLLIYRLGLIFTAIGISCGIAALVVMSDSALNSLLLAASAAFFIGFGIDFIVKRSMEDVMWLINFFFNPVWDLTGTPPFKNSNEKDNRHDKG